MEEVGLEGGIISNEMGEFSLDFPGFNVTMNCFTLPTKRNSHGIIGSIFEQTHFLTFSLPLLELQMGFILILSHATCFLLKRFGISAFVASVVAGIILGPNGLGKHDFMKEIIFPHTSQDTISTAALLGYNIYVFLAAVKMEVGMVFKTSRKALSIGVLSIAIPFISFNIYQKFEHIFPPVSLQHTMVITIAVVTSLPVVAYVVDQLKLTNTELGRLALASGLVADVLDISIFMIRVLWSTKSVDDAMRNLVPLLIFLLALAFVFRPAMDWVIRVTPEREPLNTSFIYAIMAFAIGSEAYFYFIGQAQFLAPFLFGLAVPSGAPLGSALVEKFESFTNGVLMHILIPTALMRADLYLIITNFCKLKKYMAVILVAFLFKMIACVIPSMILKMPVMEAAALAFILNYTGIVQLSIGVVFRDTGIIEEDVYALVAVYILLNATIFPKIIKELYPTRKYEDYNARNILGMKPPSELKILMCIHGQDNVESYIKLLDVIHPTKKSPISICALHLIELTGRYVPVLVAHSKHKPICTSASQNIVYALNQYEQNNWDSVSMQLITALSSFPLMHEDICNIALEKKTSLIILPLHRRWTVHGEIELEDKSWRSVNCDVLEKAPCSVAIFFNRGRLGRKRLGHSKTSNLSICMIFIGGPDDREALMIAKRMLVESETTTLTVLHCLPKDCIDVGIAQSEDQIYDIVLIDDIKHMTSVNERIEYRPRVMKDGPTTVMVLRLMADMFDLFIVGRRYGIPTPQTSGLSEWSELPELGTIGDLFASKDLKTRASVLVVQQQRHSYRQNR